jgi:hypothetical protein
MGIRVCGTFGFNLMLPFKGNGFLFDIHVITSYPSHAHSKIPIIVQHKAPAISAKRRPRSSRTMVMPRFLG